MNTVLEQLVETARRLSRAGLVTGAGGNVSACEEQTVWISPSGLSFEDAAPEDYPCVELGSGRVLAGRLRPSSELLMHLAIYRVRPEVQAVIHTHPKMTIALTAAGHDLRPMYADYHVYLGANVPHLPYITVTTPQLADAVAERFQAGDCYGMILRNHGAITVGASIREALYRTLTVEEQACIQWHALQAGTPTFLTPEQCAELDHLDSEAYRRALLSRATRT